FLGKWHKKVAGLRGNICRPLPQSLYRAPDCQSECGFLVSVSGSAGFFPRNRTVRNLPDVEPILVLRIRGAAKGPVSGNPAARPHRQGDGGARHAGLDGGHGRLAEGWRNSGLDLNWLPTTGASASPPSGTERRWLCGWCAILRLAGVRPVWTQSPDDD